ncbi:hypothetical protein DOTSEDRAFT_37138 [Dothistroma septosporum NZE10]|uniref:Uncharacterized protein n=1 Tax=Dothistroma septosporum (strain NZE10 / CBS 128990) TaxID=675120 RepID=N1PGS5_DOTSN|nr:hypothetical protein DOTSEDRAFT_37138 [Dothistroma septosporum NZE10]
MVCPTSLNCVHPVRDGHDLLVERNDTIGVLLAEVHDLLLIGPSWTVAKTSMFSAVNIARISSQDGKVFWSSESSTKRLKSTRVAQRIGSLHWTARRQTLHVQEVFSLVAHDALLVLVRDVVRAHVEDERIGGPVPAELGCTNQRLPHELARTRCTIETLSLSPAAECRLRCWYIARTTLSQSEESNSVPIWRRRRMQ